MINIQKLIKATTILGLGMATESVETIKKCKPEKFMGVYTHKPIPKAYIIFDKNDPLDLNKAQFKLNLDGDLRLRFIKCLELREIECVKFEKWYRCTTYKKYVVRFKKDKSFEGRYKKLNNLYSEYRNCADIQKEVLHAFNVASARYYSLLKEHKAFPDQIKSVK